MVSPQASLVVALSIWVPLLVGCSAGSDVSPQDTTQDLVADAVAAVDCPFGLVRGPDYGVCAPRVDKCEAWEVPAIGGGCMAVGPRACPKLWAPESDVDCDPGELLPCIDGFMLTEDQVACVPRFDEDCGEMTIPVLGGGCAPVGPRWEHGSQVDHGFDTCGPGQIALPGGGCILAGPRACPALWEPDGDHDCSVGDVLPCPDGWVVAADDTSCSPVLADCPPGEVALPGGACEPVFPATDDCPDGVFPDPPEGADTILYAQVGSPCTAGCGSEESPYPSIQEAIDAAPAGAAVVVAEGLYDEGLRILKPLKVKGLCAARVILTGTTVLEDDPSNPFAEVGLAVTDTTEVQVSGVSVLSAAPGVLVTGSQGVSLQEMEVGGSQGPAVTVTVGSEAEIRDLWAHHAADAAPPAYGFGLFVVGGSVSQIRDSLVEATASPALYVAHVGTEATVEGSVLRDGDHFGVVAESGGHATLRATLLDGNSERGVLVYDDGTEVLLEETVVRKTQATTSGLPGIGVQAVAGGAIELDRCVIEETRGAAVVSLGAGAEIVASRTVIRANETDAAEYSGVGISATEGSRVTARGCLLDANQHTGAQAGDEGTSLALLGTVVRDTLPDAVGNQGIGAAAYDGAWMVLTSSLFEGNAEAGVLGTGYVTEVVVQESVIRDTRPRASGQLGEGIIATYGCDVAVNDSLLEDNTEAGLLGQNATTEIQVEGSVIRGTRANGNGEHGQGVMAEKKGRLVLSNCLLDGNERAGVEVQDDGTEVHLQGCAIRNTRWTEGGELGFGVLAMNGSLATLAGCLVEGNARAGVLAREGGTAQIEGSVVRSTVPDETGKCAGIGASLGARVEISGSLVDDNLGIGLYALEADAEALADATVVRATRAMRDTPTGLGVSAVSGGRVVFADGLIEENTLAGAWSLGEGTEVFLEGTVLRNTLPGVDGSSQGVTVTEGGLVRLDGCLVEGSATSNLNAFNAGSHVDARGLLVRNDEVEAGEAEGSGLVVLDAATAEVSQSLFMGNATGAVWAVVPGSAISLAESAILGTRVGADWINIETNEEAPAFGDGALAVDSGHLEIASTVVADSARAGIYYNHASGAVSDCVIAGNASYGLAMEGSAPLVAYQDQGNVIAGNGADLPPGLEGQTTTNPEGLPVPPPPQVALPDL